MGRGKWKKKLKNAGEADQLVALNKEPAADALSRLVAVHPSDDIVVTVVSNQVRGYNFRTKSAVTIDTSIHGGPIRSICFNQTGSLLLTGSDDKSVRIWDTSNWQCQATMKAPKKISAATFTRDSGYAVFSDRFGDVLVGHTTKPSGSEDFTPSLLMGHLSSIITTLIVTSDNKYVISTDRDYKIRVTNLPADPLQGAYEIESYCLGHRAFVSCATLIKNEGTEELLSGGGDGTVRLWNHAKGELLDTFVAAAPRNKHQVEGAVGEASEGPADASNPVQACTTASEAQEGAEETGTAGQERGTDGADEDGERVQAGGAPGDGGGGEVPGRRSDCDAPAVLSLAASASGWVAVAVEGEHAVTLLRRNLGHKLEAVQKLSFPDVLHPCALVFDHRARLWVVGGPPLQSSTSLHIGVAVASADGVYEVATGATMSDEVRAALEQRNPEEETELQGATLASYSEHLKKRAYTVEELMERKKLRTDFKESARLKQLGEEHEAAAAAAAAAAAVAQQ